MIAKIILSLFFGNFIIFWKKNKTNYVVGSTCKGAGRYPKIDTKTCQIQGEKIFVAGDLREFFVVLYQAYLVDTL